MEKIILSKELKILLLKILKSGELTFNEAKAIIKPFENHLSIDEAKAFLIKLENEF